MVWPTNYLTCGVKKKKRDDDDDTTENPVNGQALLDQR